MQKPIIITGVLKSGKSKLAQELAYNFYKENEVVLLDGKSFFDSKNNFKYQNIYFESKCLIIDDVSQYEKIIEYINNNPFFIKVKKVGNVFWEHQLESIIITFDVPLLAEIPESIKRRIIHIPLL